MLVVDLDLLELVLDLGLQILNEILLHFPNSYFVEVLKSFFLGAAVEILQLMILEGALAGDVLADVLGEDVVRLFQSFLALILADVGPGAFDAWDGALVDRLHVALNQVPEHGSVQRLAVDFLGLDTLQNLASQAVDLLNELWAEFAHWLVGESLKAAFVGEWSDHGDAISLVEEALEQPSNSVLLLDAVRESLLVCQGLLKVVFG